MTARTERRLALLLAAAVVVAAGVGLVLNVFGG